MAELYFLHSETEFPNLDKYVTYQQSNFSHYTYKTLTLNKNKNGNNNWHKVTNRIEWIDFNNYNDLLQFKWGQLPFLIGWGCFLHFKMNFYSHHGRWITCLLYTLFFYKFDEWWGGTICQNFVVLGMFWEEFEVFIFSGIYYYNIIESILVCCILKYPGHPLHCRLLPKVYGSQISQVSKECQNQLLS